MSPYVALRRLVEFNPPVPQKIRLKPEENARLLPMEAIQHFEEPHEGEVRPIGKLLQGYAYMEPMDIGYAKVTPCFENGKGLIGSDLDGSSFASSEVTVLRPGPHLDQKYLSYVLKSEHFRGPAIASMTGAGGLKRVDEQDMRALKIWLPTLNQQYAIAASLDKEAAEIDAFIDEQEELIGLLEERRVATITHAVTRGLNFDVPMKDSGFEWLGSIPEHWEARKIKSFVSIPVTDGPHETPEILSSGVPFVSAEAVSSGTINFEKIRGFISKEDNLRFSMKYVPRLHDIYMVKSGATTGVSALVDTDIQFNIWSPLAAIRCNEDTSPHFVLHALRSRNFQESVRLFWNYGTQQNIGMKVLENLPVPYPDLSEQISIAEYLDREVAEFDAAVADAELAIALSKERRAALISAAVTGQIDVTQKHKPVAEVLEDEVGVRV